MSSTKGSSNSNKTAHVMNLLRKSNPPPQPAKPEAPPAPDAAPTQPAPAPAAPAPAVPPILTSLHADAEVSTQIRDALADELAREADEEPPAPVLPAPTPIPEEPEPEPTPQPEAPAEEPDPQEEDPTSADLAFSDIAASLEPQAVSPQVEEAAVEIPEPIPEEVPAAPAPPAKPAPAPAEVPAPEPDPTEAISINVMERLTEERADKYIRLFGLCTCPRCRKDVIALALNHLAPKYVVMSPLDFQIRSDFYAAHYGSEITAQLLWACKTVMDNPRHDLP